jgi:hypothetical protein
MKGKHILKYHDFEIFNNLRTQQTYSTFLISAYRYIDISIYHPTYGTYGMAINY